MAIQVEVYLDRWEERQNILLGMDTSRTDDASVYNAFVEEANNRPCFGRHYGTGRYGLIVRILEAKPGEFLASASAILYPMSLRKRGRKHERRERPVRPYYLANGDVRWKLLREGVFEDYPWDDEMLLSYIEETFNLLRSPEIPKHYELHEDYNSDDDL